MDDLGVPRILGNLQIWDNLNISPEGPVVLSIFRGPTHPGLQEGQARHLPDGFEWAAVATSGQKLAPVDGGVMGQTLSHYYLIHTIYICTYKSKKGLV